jgi:hypothetical protein
MWISLHGPHGTGVAHLPEVVLVAEALDALERHADLLVPDRLGFVVAVVDRDPQTVTVEAPALGHQFPAPRDRALFEVVAEAEVAHHLEEHEMTFRAAHVVEVVVLAAGADTFLRAHGTAVRRCLVADEVRLERHHPGDREQHGGIVRDEAGRRHDGVFLGREVIPERVTELVGGQRPGHASEPTEGCTLRLCG